MAIVTGRCGNVTLLIAADAQIFNAYAWSLTQEVELHDSTVYSDGYWRRFRPGLKGWTATISFYADDDLGSECLGVEAVFAGIVERDAGTGVNYTGSCWIQSIEHTNEKGGQALYVINDTGEGALSTVPTPSPACVESCV